MYQVRRGSQVNSAFHLKVSFAIRITRTAAAPILLDVISDDTVWDVKNLIRKKIGVPPKVQDMSHRGRALDENALLSYYGIYAGRGRSNDIKLALPFPVNIKTDDGRVLEVMVREYDTPQVVKYLVRSRLGIDLSQQRLFIDEQEVKDDGRTLRDYGIYEGGPMNQEILVVVPFTLYVHGDDYSKDFQIWVESWDTVQSVRNKLSQELPEVDSADIILKVDGKEMEPKYTLGDYGIYVHSQKIQALRFEVLFPVRVTIEDKVDPRKVEVKQVSTTDSVEKLKDRITAIAGMDTRTMVLFVDTLKTREDSPLKAYGLYFGSRNNNMLRLVTETKRKPESDPMLRFKQMPDLHENDTDTMVNPSYDLGSAANRDEGPEQRGEVRFPTFSNAAKNQSGESERWIPGSDRTWKSSAPESVSGDGGQQSSESSRLIATPVGVSPKGGLSGSESPRLVAASVPESPSSSKATPNVDNPEVAQQGSGSVPESTSQEASQIWLLEKGKSPANLARFENLRDDATSSENLRDDAKNKKFDFNLDLLSGETSK